MTDRILVRNVPPEIHSWIEQERRESILTQNEFVLGVLQKEYRSRQDLPLFRPATAPAAALPRQSPALPFTFTDLFAGIGGLRLGLERVGGRCVFSSEWDRYAQKTYKAWFGEVPKGDIRKINPAEIPDHDVLAAGFPCQPFSIAGVSKKKSLGHDHGFRDVTQGTLFFHLATIIEIKRPPVLMLENVKNLLSHDKGRTWEVIRGRLHELEYKTFPLLLDAAAYVPQHRERVFVVGFDKRVFGDDPPFDPPTTPKRRTATLAALGDILEDNPDPKYTLTDHLWGYLKGYADKHRELGNGFGYGLADLKGITRTLSARYYKDGSEILIPQTRRNPRRLTPPECARLMGFDRELAAERGFPEGFPIAVSDTQAYRQFGNAVVPAVAEAVARQILHVIAWHVERSGSLIKSRAVAV